MVGLAFTYNEPLIGWEYVRDCAKLARDSDLACVLVSNGCASESVVRVLAPLTDAANIDLKSFSPAFYQSCAGHLEITTLVVTGINDSADEMRQIARWLASVDPNIVLHVTRFFPRWRLRDRPATPVEDVYRLADVAREELASVVVGNC